MNKWFVDKEAVFYGVDNCRNGEIPNETIIKASIDYEAYQKFTENPLPKFKCLGAMFSDLKRTIKEEVNPFKQ